MLTFCDRLNQLLISFRMHICASYRITLCMNILWQRRRVLTAGITTRAAVSMCRRLTLSSRLLVTNA